jgi:hypothetical protein
MTLSPISHHNRPLTSAQGHTDARTLLQDTFSSFEIHGYQYTQNAVWDVVLSAAVHRASVKSACETLVEAPSCPWLYTALQEGLLEAHDLESLERHTNDLLETTFPKRLTHHAPKVAIDVVCIPYYGNEATEGMRRSQAKRGTTKFFCSASAYLIKKQKRVTLCCPFVRAQDTRLGVLMRLRQRIQVRGIRVKRVYLERGFAQGDVLRYLQPQAFVAIVAVPKKGHTLKNLQRGKQSLRTQYTMTSPQYGHVTFPVWVACRYRKGRAKKHGVQYLFFAVLGNCVRPVLQVAQEYRHRFGIESSDRIMHQARAKTTSRNPKLRLLLVVIAFLVVNLGVWYKWQILLLTRRRSSRFIFFTLDIFCHFIAHHIEHIYGIVSHLKL